MRRRVFHLGVVSLLVSLTALVRAGDVPKSADFPLIKRYEGSTIVRYQQKAYDQYQLIVGPLVGRGSDARFPKVLKLEGRVTRITYLVPPGRSPLEVFRNYEQDLKKAGFTTLFSGAHEALGQGPDDTPFPETRYADLELPGDGNPLLSAVASTSDQFLAAKLARPEGEVHIALYSVAIGTDWGKYVSANPPDKKKTAVDGQVLVQLDVVEAKPMWAFASRIPAFFRGTLEEGPDLLMRRATQLSISAARPIRFHVDGEPRTGPRTLTLRMHPGALRVRVR